MQKLICFILFISIFACSPKLRTTGFDTFDNPDMKFNQYSQEKIDALKALISQNKDNIKTLNQDDVINLLGMPFLEKDSLESNTIIWQYRGICTLNIIWKRVSQNQTKNKNLDTSLDYKISWLEALDISKNTFDYSACFSLILKN